MTLDLNRIKAICFDVDGTLSDTDDQWVSVLERRLALLRRLFPGSQVRPFARWAIMWSETPGNIAYHLLDRVNLDNQLGRMLNFVSLRMLGHKPGKFLIIQGMQTALHLLSQNYPLSVVSARGEASTLDFLNQFELLPYFQSVATAYTCRYTKPFPDPVLWAASRMGVPAENCLMVGDTTVDIRAGKSAGAQTVGVLCGFGQERELRRAGADLILADTSSLVDILLPNQL